MIAYRGAVAWTIVCLFVALANTPVHAVVVYNQPSDFPAGTLFASQNDTAGGFGNFATTFDNFTLTAATTITDVHWQGGYFNPPTLAPISTFTLIFWDNSAVNTPGAALLTAHIPGNANETLVGPGSNVLIFDYSVDLPVPFVAAGGTTYWLSIVPDLPFPPQWGWHTGTGGDGRVVQDFSGRSVLETDLAFALTGEVRAVPGPASLALVVAGIVAGLPLLGLGALKRRRMRGRTSQ
jgi:hypothetical protein